MNRVHTVDSFGPELLVALLRGSKSRFEIPLPSYRMAVRFQLRMNQLRKAMRETNHPMSTMVSRASISIQWPMNTTMIRRTNGVRTPTDKNIPATIVIQPHDLEFNASLLAAGVAPAELHEDPLDPLAAPVAPTITDAEPDPGSSILDQVLHRKPPRS